MAPTMAGDFSQLTRQAMAAQKAKGARSPLVSSSVYS